MKKILLVEDNETIVMGLRYSLEQENFQVISAKSVAESTEKIKQEQIDIVLLDVSLPDGNGFDLYKNNIKEKKTKFIQCIDCGEWLEVDNNSKLIRCPQCQKIERRRIEREKKRKQRMSH